MLFRSNDMITDLLDQVTAEFASKTPAEEWDWPAIEERVGQMFNLQLGWPAEERQELDRDSFAEKLRETIRQAYDRQEERNGAEQMRQLERMVLLQMVDTLWKEHLLQMDHLKEGIGLRGYGQKNPLNEYKREGYNLFRNLIEAVKLHTVANLMRIQLVQDDELARDRKSVV